MPAKDCEPFSLLHLSVDQRTINRTKWPATSHGFVLEPVSTLRPFMALCGLSGVVCYTDLGGRFLHIAAACDPHKSIHVQ